MLEEYLLIILFLLTSHLNSEDLFSLGRQGLFYVFFNPTEQKHLQLLMQTSEPSFVRLPMTIFKVIPGIKPERYNNGILPTLERLRT